MLFRSLANKLLDRFEQRYDYDVNYMRHMLKTSPAAFKRLRHLSAFAAHRESVTIEASFAAKLVATVAEDCGPCTQLAAKMAEEAGMEVAQIEAVLERSLETMDPSTALGFRFAEALVFRQAELGKLREDVRTKWGDRGIIDLTVATQINRLFPMLKAGLGRGEACSRVSVGGRPITVEKFAQ